MPAVDSVSYWWRQLGGPPARAPLPGDRDADVCVVGAGYTGLWTAYYLKRLQPDLRIVVVEQRFAGFGASGRNGGWLTNSVTGGRERYGRAAGTAQQRAMNDCVHEVIAVAAQEGIDTDIVVGGELNIARNAAQLGRLRATYAAEQDWPRHGSGAAGRDSDRRAGPGGGRRRRPWNPHCARIQPAKLVVGLATAVERLGVTIYEDTRVQAIRPGRAVCDRGTVRADHVIRATEGFTAELAGEHRTWLPMNSSIVITEPLPESVLAEIGWSGGEVLGDFAHAYMYAQRTADGRIAFGGRGVPYRYGSRVDRDGETSSADDRRARTGCSGSSSRPRPTSRSIRPGPACWACRGTGPRRAATTGGAGWASPAGTSAPASPPPTWPVARWPIWCWIETPIWSGCPGSTTGPDAGSRNRSAGSACTASTRPTGWPTAGSGPAAPRPRRSPGSPTGSPAAEPSERAHALDQPVEDRVQLGIDDSRLGVSVVPGDLVVHGVVVGDRRPELRHQPADLAAVEDHRVGLVADQSGPELRCHRGDGLTCHMHQLRFRAGGPAEPACRSRSRSGHGSR